jgi:hypothetical protein
MLGRSGENHEVYEVGGDARHRRRMRDLVPQPGRCGALPEDAADVLIATAIARGSGRRRETGLAIDVIQAN